MGQQHVPQARVVLRLVLLQPQNFRRGVTRQHQKAGLGQQGRLTPGAPGELGAFGGGRSVVPELDGSDCAALAVEGHKAVLLAGDPDRRDCRAQFGPNGLKTGDERRFIPLGALFAGTVIPGNDIERRLGFG